MIPDYPPTRQGPDSDDYFGELIADPYRWLEDSSSDETRAWIESQNEVTFGFLNELTGRKPLRKRLEHLWDYTKFGVPWRNGGRTFLFKNEGLQNQPVLYVLDPEAEQPRVLLDPNLLADDGTVALTGQAVSEDGNLLAYGLSKAGSDWQEWRVRDVGTAADLEDHLQWVKFSPASWTHDHQGFYYSRYDEPDPAGSTEEALYYHKLYYHRLGTPQTEDRLVYERPDQKEWLLFGKVSPDGRYLVVTAAPGTDPRCGVFVQDLHDPAAPVQDLFVKFDAAYEFVGNDASLLWFVTDLDAPRRRLVAVDLNRPEPEHWRELVPEAEDTLEEVTLLNNSFVLRYLHHACSRVVVHSLQGEHLWEVALPGLGAVQGFDGKREDSDTYFAYTGFNRPATIYRYDFTRQERSVYQEAELAFDPADYVTRQVFASSKDGTRVPVFLSHRRDLNLTSPRPTLLYGYGGFNISLTPQFSVPWLLWMELGGVLAVANLRGGGEYGEGWHQAGTKAAKQNVFDDFVAVAEHLIAQGVSCRENLAISGRSNGGLLVGACMTQRPDLFAAAVPGVGVLDMLRFHKFTIGWAWTSDYGCADEEEDFNYLRAYSPLHNLREGVSYPATLIITADHDDRVVPAHSFKFAAALQAVHRGEAPVLIRIDVSAGHGMGKPTTKSIEEWADIYAFLEAVLPGFEVATGEPGEADS